MGRIDLWNLACGILAGAFSPRIMVSSVEGPVGSWGQDGQVSLQ